MFRKISRLVTGSAVVVGLLGGAAASWAQSEVKSPTLDAVKKRGQVICGVDTGIPGYAFQDFAGKWQGLDVPCAAPSPRRRSATREGEVYRHDLEGALLGAAVRRDRPAGPRLRAHLTRNSQLGLVEPTPNFFTGQTIMVARASTSPTLRI